GGSEQERRRELLHDEVAHGLLGADRAAEVALRHPSEPAHVLPPERLIEAELVAERLPRGVLGVLAEHGVDRVAGDEVDDREHHQRHEEEHRDGPEQAATQIRAYAAAQGRRPTVSTTTLMPTPGSPPPPSPDRKSVV